MPIYTVRDSQTGKAYDLPLYWPIEKYSEADIEQMISHQDAQRASDVRTSEASALMASRFPRGSTQREELLRYEPTDIPGYAETTARDLGAALAGVVPNMARSAMMLNAGFSAQAPVNYVADSVARLSSGQSMQNPFSAVAQYMAGVRGDPTYQDLESWSKSNENFYDYNRENVSEEQQAFSQAVGGGIGSALGYAATIPIGAAGLMPMALGQSVAPTAEKYLDRGVSPERSIAQALISGGIEAGSELVLGVPGKIARRLGLAPQMARLFKPIADRVDGLVKSWLGEMGINMTQEGVEEMISGLSSDLSSVYITGADPRAMDNMLDSRIQEFIGGAIGGAVLSPAARQARQDIDRRADNAEGRVQLREALKSSLMQLGQATDASDSTSITGISEAIARANNPTDIPLRVSPFVPTPQDIPIDPLTQIKQDQINAVPGNVQPFVPTPQDIPIDPLTQIKQDQINAVPGNVQPSVPTPQDIPIDPLTQIKQDQINAVPGNVQPSVPTPQDIPIDPLTQISSATRSPNRASVRRLKSQTEGPSIADLELRTARKIKTIGGEQNEEEMQKRGTQVTPSSTGAAILAAPPMPSDEPPNPDDVEAAARAMEAPPFASGLSDAKTTNDHIRIFKARVKEISKEKSSAIQEKLLSDLLDEHRPLRTRFVDGKKRKDLADLESWAASALSKPDQAWVMMELAVDSDLVKRQQDWLKNNLKNIGDVPGIDASPEEVIDYERRAKMPAFELAFSPAQGSTSPWESPTTWLNSYLKTQHGKNQKRQETNRHIFIEIKGEIFLMPVYDKGTANTASGERIEASQRVMIGDPDLFYSAVPKFRITAGAFATKYLGRAKYLGTIRLPVASGKEWMAKTKWTLGEVKDISGRLLSLQEDALQQSLYPADAEVLEVADSTEVQGGIDTSFMEQLSVREPAMAHISDFVNEFALDDPPVSGGVKAIRRWVIARYESWIKTSPDARQVMNQVVAVAMRSAVVRDVGAETQTVSGMPLHISNKPEYAKRWFKDQLANAFIAEIQSQPGVIAIAYGQALGLVPEAGNEQGIVSSGTRSGVARELATRIAPALSVGEQELRSRGLRTSGQSDYTSKSRKLRVGDRSRGIESRARKLARLRARGEIQSLSVPVSDESRIKSDLRTIREQVKASAKKVKASVPDKNTPVGAPALRWKKLKDSSGYNYWVAPPSPEFDQWMKDNPQSRKAIDVYKEGSEKYYTTNSNPKGFTKGNVTTPEGVMAYQEAALAIDRRIKKKNSVRLSAARPVGQGDAEGGFSEEFQRSFKRVGGNAIRFNDSLDGPIAVEITADGQIVLAMNPGELSKLSADEWTAVWDEELRHAALLSFARSRLRVQGFIGDIGTRVSQDLAQAWSAIDEPTRAVIEVRLKKIYGRNLNDAQKTAELVRMIGQGQITEEVTRRGLGQRFLDLVRDFAQWLRQQFKANIPQPIQELLDGSDAILNRVESGQPDLQVTQDPSVLSIGAAESKSGRQRLTLKLVERARQSGNLGVLGNRRMDEMESIQADLLDSNALSLIGDLLIQSTTAILPGMSAFDRRLQQDEKRSAGIAWGRVRTLRDLTDLKSRISPTAQSAGQKAMAGIAQKLTDKQQMEVMHDAVGVVDVHEQLDADMQRLEGQIGLALEHEASSLRSLASLLGTLPNAQGMKQYIKNRLNTMRSDVARAFELSNIATENHLANSLHQNIPIAGDQVALNAALSALGNRQAVDDLKFLVERLSNDPNLQNLTNWPVDEDAFFNQLMVTGVLQSVIKGGPGLSSSVAIASSITSPATGIRPPLQAWGQLRSVIESLQGYAQEHALALADLKQLALIVDPLANIPRDKSVSYRRALALYQSSSMKMAGVISRLSQYDNSLRTANIARRGIERAMDVMSQTMQGADYRTMVENAVSITNRRADQVIYDTVPSDGKRLSTITVMLPVPEANGKPRVKEFELSFEQDENDANRLAIQESADEIETWLSTNSDKDPVKIETYRAALIRLRHWLNPNYAISEGTINESGLWGFLTYPLKLPVLRDFLHPVLKEIDDSSKGLAKGLISRAVAPFVRWGLFEQGLRPDLVKIKSTKRDGMESHKMITRFRARHILDPFRMDRQDDDYRWLIIEPIIRSWQNSLQLHLEAGNFLPDHAAQISISGKILITPQDIEAARAQVAYERKVRNFTTIENFGFGEAQSVELRIDENAPGNLGQRSRLPFAAGPGVMSRSLAHKANGPAMTDYRKAREQVPQTVGSDNKVILDEDGMTLLRRLYGHQFLRGTATAGVTDAQTWTDVIMAHILETNPEYAIRENSTLSPIYNSIAQDIFKGNRQITNWNDLTNTIADRMQTQMGDTRPYALRLNEAEIKLVTEITNGMENIRVILDNQTSAATSDVHVMAPKSSFTTARGSIVGAPGLYEYGLHSDFAVNALHGTVLRHVTNNLMNAMATMSSALEVYIQKYDGTRANNISQRKKQGKAAYYLTEAIRLNKGIKDQLQVMNAFEAATRDPEQYYHDVMRWSTFLLIKPMISVIANPYSVIKDTLLTISVGATRQRRSLWENVNWWFTTAGATARWLESAATVALASFATTPGNRRLIKRAIVSMVPGMAGAVHSASRRVAELRLDGAVRGISMADESILMSTSGSLLGVQGALEFERTRPLLSKAIKIIDRGSQRIPLIKQIAYMVGESRTIAEDINSLMLISYGDSDLIEVTRRSMEALSTRDRMGNLIEDQINPGYALTEQELGMSFGGLRQLRRWFEPAGFDASMLSHYLANRGKTIDEMVKAPLPKGARRSFADNYITESQVQTLRERPAVSFKKGLVGRVARMFTTLKVWSSNAFFSYVQGEILRTNVTKPFYTRVPDELARMLAMLILLMVLGAPSVVAIDWLRDKTGRPQGLTVENLIREPNLQAFLTMAVGIGTQVIPLGSLFEEGLTGWGQGTIDIFRLAPALSGAQGFYRAIATIVSTSNWSDPKSVADAAAYQFSGLAARMFPTIGYIRGSTNEGLRQYVEAGQSIRKLASSDIERSPRTQGRIPSSPAYDNVRRAVQFEAEGKADEAEAELKEGLRQIIDSGVSEDSARTKLQAAFSAQSGFRGGFERSLTDDEKAEILERATPTQRASILNREAAVQRLSGLLRKGRSSLASGPVGGGRGGGRALYPKVDRRGSNLAARLRRGGRAANSPSRRFLRPIQIKTRRRRSSSLARLARLRRKLGRLPTR